VVAVALPRPLLVFGRRALPAFEKPPLIVTNRRLFAQPIEHGWRVSYSSPTVLGADPVSDQMLSSVRLAAQGGIVLTTPHFRHGVVVAQAL
jgi:hypothetical protein